MENKKRAHHLLKELRNGKSNKSKSKNKAKTRMSLNQQRLVKKPDHFVDLFTGDQTKKLHDKKTVAREYNQNYLYENANSFRTFIPQVRKRLLIFS